MLNAERALTRDVFKRARWFFLAFTAIIATLFLILASNANITSLPTNHLQIHHILLGLILIAINCLISFALCDSQDNTIRIQPFVYRLPRSTPWIVAWQMITAMALATIAHLIVACLARELWGFQWPILTLTAVMVTITAVGIAITLLFENTPILQILTHVTSLFAFWAWTSAHYVPKGFYVYWNPNPNAHNWLTLSSTDIFTLTVVIAAAYALGIFAASHNRCGQGIQLQAIKQFFTNLYNRLPFRKHPFQSAFNAQLWFQWRTNGVGPLAIAIIIGLIVNTLYLFDLIRVNDFLPIIFTLCFICPVFCTSGIAVVYANHGSDFKNQNMSTYLASLPLSDTRMLLHTLFTALACWATLWIIAIIGFALTCLNIILCEQTQQITESLSDFRNSLNEVNLSLAFAIFTLFILIGWINLTFIGTWVLWGRPRIIATLCGAFAILFFSTMIAQEQGWMSPPTFLFIKTNLILLIATLLTLATAAASYFALKKQLINLPTLTSALIICTLIIALIAWTDFQLILNTDSPLNEFFSTQLHLHIAAWLTFALAATLPIPAAPLALNANRHR